MRFNTHVHVIERDQDGKLVDGGRQATFGPDDDLPDWAIRSTTNPDVWAGDPPPHARRRSEDALRRDSRVAMHSTAGVDQSAEITALKAEIAALKAGTPVTGSDTAAGSDTAKPPPMGGPGSGAPEWRAYAAAAGVEVPADASRDDVIAALEAAGTPTK